MSMEVKNGKPIRVGFIYTEGDWLGGLSYLRNLMAAVRLLPDNRLVPVVITAQSTDAEKQFPQTNILRTKLLDRWTYPWAIRRAKLRVLGWDQELTNLLFRHHVEVLSHSTSLGGQSKVATIAWIPDFQHVHLPELFSKKEHRNRTQSMLFRCSECTKLVLSSNCALADLENFSPAYAYKADVLHFVAGPVADAGVPGLETLQSKYGFNSPFFLLPNQFWAHKNHRVVIDALRELRDEAPEIRILATGLTHDRRNPAFFDSLMEYAAECRVLDAFRVLGPIPYQDLIGLMRYSMAMINPSKFEGWSTSVEEAKSMGKQILLSHIPVHREQAPSRGKFFSPDDPEGLAELLVETYRAYDQKADFDEQEQAARLLPARQLEFARTYERIVAEALEKHSVPFPASAQSA